jgi:hypothetical protein
MTIQQYIPLASRTRVDLGSNELNIDHMMLGVATEISELLDIHKKQLAYNKPIDWVNYKEEIGDLAWYFAGYADIKEIAINEDYIAIASLFSNDKVEIQLLFEKEYLYLKNIGDNICTRMLRGETKTIKFWFAFLQVLLTYHNLGSLSDVMETNIAKLKARYTEKYSDELALNRNLNAEREILEK